MATNPELDPFVNQPAAPQQPQVFTLNLDANIINVILASLQELPHRVADPVLRNIMQQIQAQASQSQM